MTSGWNGNLGSVEIETIGRGIQHQLSETSDSSLPSKSFWGADHDIDLRFFMDSRDRTATNSRDKIYALRRLITNDEFANGIKVDYAKSVERVLPLCMIAEANHADDESCYGLFVAIGQTLLMASLAEYTSIWPTAGGQQYYTQAVSTGPWRPFLSYVVGWAVLVGEISTGSSCAVNNAAIVASFIEVTHPNVNWKPWMTWIIYSVFLIAPILINLKQTWLPSVNVLGALWTIAGGIAWTVVFGVMAKPKHDAAFVFKLFLNNTGYVSNGWVSSCPSTTLCTGSMGQTE
jgi:Amino acid permease